MFPASPSSSSASSGSSSASEKAVLLAFGAQPFASRFDVTITGKAHHSGIDVSAIVPTLVTKAATAAATGLMSFAKSWWGGSAAAGTVSHVATIELGCTVMVSCALGCVQRSHNRPVMKPRLKRPPRLPQMPVLSCGPRIRRHWSQSRSWLMAHAQRFRYAADPSCIAATSSLSSLCLLHRR